MSELPIGDGMEHVRALAGIGNRSTGSEGERKAADYLCGVLHGWGLKEARTEPFPAKSWDFSVCRLEGDGASVDALPIEYSGSTPEKGIEAEMVVCESAGDVVKEDVEGKVVLVNGGSVPDAGVLMERKAAGIVVVSADKPRAWHLIYGPAQPLAGKLPMVTIGFGDAVELLKRGVKRLRLEVQTVIEEVEGLNVVGTMPGKGDGKRRVNISGHYDSVVTGPAAADNATGAACAMEVARGLTREPLDATVDLVLFSAEEIGLYGAEAYAREHAEEIADTELGIYFDGQGDFLGRSNIHVLGQKGLAEMVEEVIDGVGYRADVRHHFTGLDQVFLSAAGVPTLWFQRGPQLTWHTSADVVEDVSPQAMRKAIGAAAAIALRAIEEPGCFQGGIPEEQASRIAEYLKEGAPVW